MALEPILELRAVPTGRREGPCEVCGRTFRARRADARACSGSCRMRAHRQRLKLARDVADLLAQREGQRDA